MAISPIGTIQDKSELKLLDTTLTITGVIDETNPGKYLEPFFEQVHSGILGESKTIKNLFIDITGLNFINSSGIRELVKWILKITKLSENQQYLLNFIINKNLDWQLQLLSTLKILAHKLIKVVE